MCTWCMHVSVQVNVLMYLHVEATVSISVSIFHSLPCCLETRSLTELQSLCSAEADWLESSHDSPVSSSSDGATYTCMHALLHTWVLEISFQVFMLQGHLSGLPYCVHSIMFIFSISFYILI